MNTLLWMSGPEWRPIAVDHTDPQKKAEWERWFATADRSVARDEVSKGIIVSTMFLGVGPALFETRIFRDLKSELVGVGDTVETARGLHASAVKRARRECGLEALEELKRPGQWNW